MIEVDAHERRDAPRRPARSRGTYAKNPDVRRRILDAAVAVFSQSGYRAGALRDVARLAGMSEAGVLYHFASKQTLMLEVLRRRDEWQSSWLAEYADDPGRLLRETANIAEANMSDPGAVSLFAVLSAEATSATHPAHAYFRERYANAHAVLTDAFAAIASTDGILSKRSPRSLATELMGLLDGLQIQWLYDRSIDMAAATRAFLTRHLDSSVLGATAAMLRP